MRRITTLFLALLLTLFLTACGGTAQPNPPAQTGDDASQTETPDTAPEPAEEASKKQRTVRNSKIPWKKSVNRLQLPWWLQP